MDHFLPPQRYYSLKKIAILVLILQKEDDKLEQKTRIMHNVSVGVVDLKKKRKKGKKRSKEGNKVQKVTQMDRRRERKMEEQANK